MARKYGEAELYETFSDSEISRMLLQLARRCRSCQIKRDDFEVIAEAEEFFMESMA